MHLTLTQGPAMSRLPFQKLGSQKLLEVDSVFPENYFKTLISLYSTVLSVVLTAKPVG